MKKIYFHSLCLIFGCISIMSCHHTELPNDPLLKKALSLAENNRNNLLNVLEHYSSSQDSLKYKAAVFLIRNMPGKYAKVYNEYDNYISLFDTIESLNKAYEKLKKQKNPVIYKNYKQSVVNYFLTKHHLRPTKNLVYERKEDIKSITADFLIENIDYAFRAWDMPWNKSLSFKNFCEYILPYRYGTEELQPWRKSYYENNIYLLDTFKTTRDPVKICMALKGLHNITKSEMGELNGLANSIKALDLIRINTSTTCKDETGAVLLKLRALGIPVARLTFPNWGNWGSGHDTNGVLTLNGEWFPLFGGTNTKRYTPPLHYTVAKMFVENYSNNTRSNFVSERRNISPESNYVDITGSITKVSNLIFPFSKSENGVNAFLCIFNNSRWFPIAFSKINNGKVLFQQVGQNVIYNLATADSDTLRFYDQPFLLDSTGAIKKITASYKTTSVTLSRKFPPNVGLYSKLPSLAGCYFESADDADFRNSKILWKIDSVFSLRTVEKRLLDTKFKYIRLVLPNIHHQNEAIAGIQIYGKSLVDTLIKGRFISSTKASTIFYNNMFDNNQLTFVQIYTRDHVDFDQFYDSNNLVIPEKQPFWIGLEFKNPLQITKLELSPRTDDNDIIPGETYELFYWNKNWISLGRKIAKSENLKFKVPNNALLLLKNINKGKENRIFLVQNAKQVWY